MAEQGKIKYIKDGRTGIIEFFHPAHNSLPSALLLELKTCIETASQDDGIHIILLKSSGNRTFCAGASFEELSSIKNEVEGKEFFMGFARVVNAMRKSDKVIIGRVHGKAVGGGVGIISACDYVIANQYASFRLSELEIGIGPFVIGPVVERKSGSSIFSMLSLTPGIWRNPEFGKQCGLYHEVHESTELLDHHLNLFISNLQEYSLSALKELKRIWWEDTSHWDELLEHRAGISGRLVLSHKARQIIHSLIKK
ncbi:MAG TPA: enoyl-CoA hydratase/isomerase family protein [Saprospiraceae bacterium]|nr:enoyl-CoA hydratase/isomerase family protein [Saprospiraceae bacterium]